MKYYTITAAESRIVELEADLAKYQACRVRDVDEKAWLSKRITTLEAAIRELEEQRDAWKRLASDELPSNRTVSETPEAMHARIVTETADAIAAQSETPVSVSETGTVRRSVRDMVFPQSETLVDLKDPHNAHHPDRLKGPGLTAQETKGDADGTAKG